MKNLLPFLWIAILIGGLVFTPAPKRVVVSSDPASSNSISSAADPVPPPESDRASSSASNSSAFSYRDEPAEEGYVWISDSGKRYHRNSSCSGMKDPVQVTLEEAEDMGLSPCQNCY